MVVDERKLLRIGRFDWLIIMEGGLPLSEWLKLSVESYVSARKTRFNTQFLVTIKYRLKKQPPHSGSHNLFLVTLSPKFLISEAAGWVATASS